MSEIHVRLPDGKTLVMACGSTVLFVAEQIGSGLARAALAGRIDGHLVDLRQPLERDCSIEIVTAKDPEGVEVIRHSAEHVMADAVKRLFPDVQIDVGRTDHSEKFQYDFLVDEPFTPEDVERIEKEMREIVAAKLDFTREVVTREEARRRFAEMGEDLKVSRLDDIPEDAEITLFAHGDFIDLCRGPHVRRSDQIKAFQLLGVSGSYWRGDERGPKLQRIYGTAFASAKELRAHMHRLEEAKKRDHRRIGPQLELFFMDPVSPGAPFYLPNGMILYNGLIDFVKSLYPEYGFQEVMTPILFRSELFKTSGHYDRFYDEMFWFAGADEGEELGIKAMNCPAHCEIFRSKKRSYRELPLRLAEFSRLHRNERSGTLNGMMRVRAMAQDDAHIFCEPDQVSAEVDRFFEMMSTVYEALGLEGVEMHVSTRPDEFLGSPEDWDAAEKTLIDCVERAGYPCGIKPGEAAFYAPKIEADFRDVLGRAWTLGTIQIDTAAPGRFELAYVGRDGGLHQPAMLHRAVLGSLERFIGIYIEHTAGDFPLWLAPVQAIVLPITERHHLHTNAVRDTLRKAGIRVEIDERSETLGFKIRDAETRKIPLMLVIGDREQEDGTVTLRQRHVKESGGAIAPAELVAQLSEHIAERRTGSIA